MRHNTRLEGRIRIGLLRSIIASEIYRPAYQEGKRYRTTIKPDGSLTEALVRYWSREVKEPWRVYFRFRVNLNDVNPAEFTKEQVEKDSDWTKYRIGSRGFPHIGAILNKRKAHPVYGGQHG